MTRTHGNIGGTSVAGIVVGVLVAGGVFVGVRQLMPCSSSCAVPGAETAVPGAGVVPAVHTEETGAEVEPVAETDGHDAAEAGDDEKADCGGCCPLMSGGDESSEQGEEG